MNVDSKIKTSAKHNMKNALKDSVNAVVKDSFNDAAKDVASKDEYYPDHVATDSKLVCQSSVFISKIVDALADPLFVKDSNHRFILLNNAFCAFTGHTREEFLGKSDYDFFPKEQAEIFWKKDDDVFKNGAMNINEELLTGASGDVKNIITTKTVFTDETTGEKMLVGIIRDTTEKKKLVDDLLRKNEELKRFNKIAVDRELKMIELKKELEEMRKGSGQ